MSDENTKVVAHEVAEDEKEKQEIILINEETIQNKIYIVRGQKVMLDFELAEIYGYATKRFNEQVKNNVERFDADFRFQLTKEEWDNLRSKKSTSSWGGTRYLPYAFTEQGVYMLMTVLKGDLAVNQSKALIRTFKAMKDYIVENQGLMNQRDYLQLSLVVAEHSRDIDAIKLSLSSIDNEVADVVDRLGNVVTKSELSGFMNIFGELEFRNEYVLWDGQPFESDLAYSAIYGKAEKTLYVIDNYIGVKTLALLKNSKENIEIVLFSDNVGKGLHTTEFNDFCKQYPDCKIKLKQTGRKYHDRYIVIDYGTEQEKIFHCGLSSKDGGMRIGSIVEIREREVYHTLVDELLKMPTLQLEELSTEKIKSAEKEEAEEWKKGYNLPVDDQEREEAELECKEMMGYISDIYESAYKGEVSNVVLDEKIILEMQKKLMKTNLPVTTSVTYSNMENYESVDSFLEDCMAGKNSSVVIYEIHDDGGISRMKFLFDGTDMYLVSARSVWNENGRAGIAYISNTRIKDWSYTEKGWFGYELCVPEPPEVSEIVDGSCLIRIKQMTQEQREMSERCVRGLGYQGQNLLCSNWNTENLDELDYNGIYEYFYEMKYGEKFDSEEYPNGIPKEEFESLIMEYIPVTAEQIRDYAVFDEEKQTYDWVRLGCGNYAPTFFGTSLPEVTDIKENDDGTVTLTVDAVCDMVICDDAVITHELTVRFAEDGSFQYLGNEILNDGIKQIPAYQYRISDKET